MSDITKDEYILRRLTKISKKRFEYFVISRVIHKLDDPEIEFITQQLVRRPDGKYALTDMYFPQFGIHLEVDEGQHLNEKHAEADKHRTEDIVSLTNHEVHRIAAAELLENDKAKALAIEKIKQETDLFVAKLQKLKQKQIGEGKFEPWDFDHQYSAKRHLDVGLINSKENVLLRRQNEVLELFGYQGGVYQRGAWKIPDGSGDMVWFPRLYEREDWDNQLIENGTVITETPKTKQAKDTIKKALKTRFDEGNRIVFARVQDSLGFTMYRYVGTFRLDLKHSSQNKTVYRLQHTVEKIRPRAEK